MNAEIEKLLGGYATNTLTEEERHALFEAALTDQEAFDALAAEQPLKELLDDPASRRELLRGLQPAPPKRIWLRFAAGFAALAVAVGIGIYSYKGTPEFHRAPSVTADRVSSAAAPLPASPPAVQMLRQKRAPLGIKYSLKLDRAFLSANQSGYLYVQGAEAELFAGHVKASVRTEITVPPDVEKLKIVFSRRPEAATGLLLPNRQPGPGDSFVAAPSGEGRLVFYLSRATPPAKSPKASAAVSGRLPASRSKSKLPR